MERGHYQILELVITLQCIKHKIYIFLCDLR